MIDKIIAMMSFITLCLVLLTIGYTEFPKNEIKMLISLQENEESNEDPFFAMEKLMPIGSKITRIREIDKDGNKYEIVVKTRIEKSNLIDWLLKSHKIKSVEATE